MNYFKICIWYLIINVAIKACMQLWYGARSEEIKVEYTTTDFFAGLIKLVIASYVIYKI